MKLKLITQGIDMEIEAIMAQLEKKETFSSSQYAHIM